MPASRLLAFPLAFLVFASVSFGTEAWKSSGPAVNSAVAASSESAEADSLFAGSWNGKLQAGQTELTLVFNFTADAGGGLKVTFDSPDQGAEGIEAEIVEASPLALKVNIPSLLASYSGMLYRDLIIGTFTQAGKSFPLTLERGSSEPARPQTPEPPYPYPCEEVRFENEDAGALLAGTIFWPEGYSGGLVKDSIGRNLSSAAPAVVVLVSGSGQQNRDEEIFGHKPFLVIADFLARHGIATLRYDDRNFGESHGGDVDSATTEDFMEDALAAVEFLRRSGRFSSVGVIGHSEGACIAFMLGARGAVDFVISLAGIGVKGDIALAAQSNRIMELSGVTGTVSVGEYRSKVRALAQPWLNWFIDYDPSSDIAGTACPVMAVCGDKDSQVISSLNLPAIRSLLPDNGINLVREYPGLNHLFQHCGTGAPTEYRSIEETISPELLEDMVDWMNSFCLSK